MVVAAITLTFMPQILSFFGATPKILPDACAYYSIIIGGLIFDKISFGMNNLVRAEGRPVIAMTTIIIGGLTNIFLDWLFLVKWGWGARSRDCDGACAGVRVIVGFGILCQRKEFPQNKAVEYETV